MDYTQQLQKRREETKGIREAVNRGIASISTPEARALSKIKKEQELLEAPYKKQAQINTANRISEQQSREAAAKYGLNPDMTPLKQGTVQAIGTGAGYNQFLNIGGKANQPQLGSIQDSYNRMGLNSGKSNFGGFGGSFSKQLGDLEAASMRFGAAASQRRIGEMQEESKIRESEKESEIKRQEELEKKQKTPVLKSELNRLRSNRPTPPKALMSDDEVRQYRSNLKAWEEKIADLNRQLSELNA